MVKKIP
jgi:hypothetical protein